MILSLLMVFMLFAAMVVNVGQAVNRRIALQIVADAGAWAGATNQAIGLNKLAEINLYMQEFWILLTMAEGNFETTICEIGDPALAAYYSSWGALNGMFNAVNAGYPLKAYSEARRMTIYNLADLFPGERSSQFTMMGPGAVPGAPLVNAVPAIHGMPTSPLASMQVPAWWIKNWECIVLTPPATGVVLPRVGSFAGSGLWYTKMSTTATNFWWYAKAPATRALLFDDIFGPNAIPEMEAVGAAKPVGGNIGFGQQQYVTKLVPVADAVARDPAWALLTPPDLTTHLGAFVLDSYGGVTRRRVVTH